MNGAVRLLKGNQTHKLLRIPVWAGIIVLVLGLVEVGLRIWGPNLNVLADVVQPVDDPRHYVLRPNSRIVFRGLKEPLERPVVWRINAQGLRAERDMVDTKRYRILTYGDSQTFGWLVDIQHTFQKQMESKDPRVEVVNMGIPGFNVAQVAEHLIRTASRFSPDLIVYAINNNDTDDAIRPLSSLRHSRLSQWLYLAYQTYIAEVEQPQRQSGERMKKLEDELLRIAGFCGQNNVPLILALFGWEKDSPVFDRVSRYSGGGPEPGAVRVRVVDLTPAIRGQSKHNGYLLASAHEQVAELLCRVVSEEAGSTCAPPGWNGRKKSLGPSPETGAD